MKNIELSEKQYEFISTLPKFDMEMLISEIHQFGWHGASRLLSIMQEAALRRPNDFYRHDVPTSTADW